MERERFGPYEIVGEIASGGMATVYEAVRRGEDGFARRVAIKRIHPHLAKSREFSDMFLDEARIAARVDHPNVCQVLDYGRHQGTAFLAMELLTGKTLAQTLAALARRHRSGAAHVRFVASVIAEVAEGLHAAHELRDEAGALLDVVHRDVSPQNLFVTFDGTVKVVDFGVAKARDKVHETEAGEVKGKFAYMSPEQLAGRVDRRADVWALGVVLWEGLALQRLFRRDTQSETILAVQGEEIPRPSSVRSELASSLDEVVRRALERDRDRRTPSGRALADAIVAALPGGAMSRREIGELMHALFDVDVADAPVPEASTKLARSEPRGLGRIIAAGAIVTLGAVGLISWALDAPTEPIARSAPRTPVAPAPIAAPIVTPIATPETPIPLAALVPPRATHAPVERVRRIPLTEENQPVAPPAAHGSGRVLVPARVAVCVDRPCRERDEAIFGPHSSPVSAGTHHVVYIEYEGPPIGPASPIGGRDVEVQEGVTLHLPAAP